MSELHESYDVAVVGAGPAGLAAAAECADAGLSTVLFDEQAAPGGQIYRSVGETPVPRHSIMGQDYWAGGALLEEFRSSGAQYQPETTVWSITRDREIGISHGGAASLLHAEHVIIATGALERPFPVPGWTLPGVMTAGAGQILLKSAGLVPQGRVVLAGCGPLLWLLAWQYLNAGVVIDAILDTTLSKNRLAAAPRALGFLLSPYLAKGLRLVTAVRRRVRVIPGVVDLRIEGDQRAESIVYRVGNGPEQRRATDLVLLHQGVAPNVNLAMSIGIEHRWDDIQLCWRPEVDENGSSAIDGIAIAGDGAGIGGAWTAEARGRLAAFAAIRRLRPEASAQPDDRAARRALARYDRGRAFLDTLYRPAPRFRRPQGDTLVCRCEEVTAQQIVDTVALGCLGPNQMKSFLRCGMGPCQGRMCGLTVTELIAEARKVRPQTVGYYRLRPPVKPITLAELAALPKDDSALRSVARG